MTTYTPAPQSFEATNPLLEELAIRLGEWRGELDENAARESWVRRVGEPARTAD